MKNILLAFFFSLCGLLAAAEPQLYHQKKFGEMQWQGLDFKRYVLRAEGFLPKQRYHLCMSNVTGSEMKMFTYVANQKGHLILQTPEGMEGGGYAICPVRRGERLIFLMHAEDGSKRIAAELVPFPLEMRAKSGAHLQLELVNEEGTQFRVMGAKLEPGERIALHCQFGLHQKGMVASIDEQGIFQTEVALPEGQSGRAVLVLKREKEEIFFPFHYGAPALRYIGACCLQIR